MCAGMSVLEPCRSKSHFSVVDSARPPLVTTEKNNVVAANGKIRTREITSRYKSGVMAAEVASRRCPSPNASRTLPAAEASLRKRAQSVERRRPSAPSTMSSSPSSRPSVPSTPSTKPSTRSVPSSKSSTHSVQSSRPLTPSRPSLRPSTPSHPLTRPSTPSSPSSKQSSAASRVSVSSSPSLRHSVPSLTTSRPSTPSSPSSRSTTPVRDSIAETHNSSRRSVGGRDGLWPSMRSLSTSFQSESSSPLSSKRDRIARNPSPDPKSVTGAATERKRTPLRGRNITDQLENSRPVENSHVRPIDQHWWLGLGKVPAHAFSRSMDLTDKIDRSSALTIPVRGASPRRMSSSNTNSTSISLQRSANEVARRTSSEGSKMLESSAGVNLTTHSSERSSSVTRSSRTQSSSLPVFHRPSSPSKALSVSTSRGIQSPSRTRPSAPVSPSSSTASRLGVSSSVFNYIADVRTGKKSANHTEDAHLLRLLYNRDLQWHFVNAQADAAFITEKTDSENTLYNVWNITSELCDSLVLKRINVQKLKQDMMLNQILKEQVEYLEEWTAVEIEHSTCLSGAIEALKASTLCLPVTGGEHADVRAVKNAVSSAVDVMQAMGSSICYLLSRVESTNSVVFELSNVAAKERAMVNECRELLASTAAMQLKGSLGAAVKLSSCDQKGHRFEPWKQPLAKCRAILHTIHLRVGPFPEPCENVGCFVHQAAL